MAFIYDKRIKLWLYFNRNNVYERKKRQEKSHSLSFNSRYDSIFFTRNVNFIHLKNETLRKSNLYNFD
jgi:hypothetical protein